MVNVEKNPSGLQKCLKGSLEDINDRHPMWMEVSVGKGFEQKRLNEVHDSCTKALKAYFPIRVEDKADGKSVSFFLDREMLGKLSKIEDIVSSTGIPKDIFYAMAAVFQDGQEKELGNVKISAKGLGQIDRRGFQFSPADLKELIDHPDMGKALCVAVDERVGYAYRMLLNFITLVRKTDLEWAGLAMLHSALRVGASFGIPLTPKEQSLWKERMGAGPRFLKLVNDTYDFIIFEQYIGRMFPMLSLRSRSLLLSRYNGHLFDLREGMLHNTLPVEIIEETGLTRDEISKRISDIGLIYD